MSVVEPLVLSSAVHAVAVVLDGAPVRVVSLAGRGTYAFESGAVGVTVSVHLGSAKDVDLVADLLGLGMTPPASFGPDLYGREAQWQGGGFVILYGPVVPAAGNADAASGGAAA